MKSPLKAIVAAAVPASFVAGTLVGSAKVEPVSEAPSTTQARIDVKPATEPKPENQGPISGFRG